MTGVMDRDDILDLLAIVAATDNRTVGETDVTIWAGLIRELPKDDCVDAIEAHRRQRPGVWLEPGHILERVKAVQRDRYDRMDPDERGTAYADLGGGARSITRTPDGGFIDAAGVKHDRYGYVDKAQDEPAYPAGWSGEQRQAAYWKRVRYGTVFQDMITALSEAPARDEHSPGPDCADPPCTAASTFGDYCARHYVLYAAWSRKGPTRQPARSLGDLFDRTEVAL